MGPKIKDESRTAVEGQLRNGLEWGAENLMLAVERSGNQEESDSVTEQLSGMFVFE